MSVAARRSRPKRTPFSDDWGWPRRRNSARCRSFSVEPKSRYVDAWSSRRRHLKFWPVFHSDSTERCSSVPNRSTAAQRRRPRRSWTVPVAITSPAPSRSTKNRSQPSSSVAHRWLPDRNRLTAVCRRPAAAATAAAAAVAVVLVIRWLLGILIDFVIVCDMTIVAV